MNNIIIYSNGCSHTQVCDDIYCNSYSDIVFKEYYGDLLYETTYLHTGLINNKLKFTILNSNKKNTIFRQSLYGKSNDLIFFETINFINLIYSENKNIDLLLVQWSGVNRRIHSEPDGTITNINPHDSPELGVKFEPLATEQTLQYMKLLEDICNLYNIKYVCIPYMEVDNKVFETSIYRNQINFLNYTASILVGHRNDFRKNGLAVDFHGHPNAHGVYELAKLICEKLGIDKINNKEFYFTDTELNHSPNKREQSLIKKYFKELGDGFTDIIKKDLI